MGDLPTHLMIDANIRRCQTQNMPVYVVNRGDPSRGLVCLKLIDSSFQCRIYTQLRDMEGEMRWLEKTAGKSLSESQADDMVRGFLQNDPDLWVIEVEVGQSNEIPFDGKIFNEISI